MISMTFAIIFSWLIFQFGATKNSVTKIIFVSSSHPSLIYFLLYPEVYLLGQVEGFRYFQIVLQKTILGLGMSFSCRALA
jgi:hypothetical protein